MSKFTRETVTTREQNQTPVAQTSTRTVVNTEKSKSQYIAQMLYFTLGAMEVLLSFRFILKLTGASPASSFVQFIYSITNLFILPFEGIFRRAVTDGIETAAIIEPATLVAMVVYAVVVWGIVALLRMLSGEDQSE